MSKPGSYKLPAPVPGHGLRCMRPVREKHINRGWSWVCACGQEGKRASSIEKASVAFDAHLEDVA